MTATQIPTRGSAAPRRAPAPAPAPRPVPLRVVPMGELSPRARLRRRRLIVAGIGALVVATLFGVVVEHVILAQQQFRLAALQATAAQEAATNQSLQLEVAQLQSPNRVVSEAQSKLGMVAPPGITYLAPGAHGPRVKGQPAVPPTTLPPTSAPSASGSGSTASGGPADHQTSSSTSTSQNPGGTSSSNSGVTTPPGP